MVSGAKEKSGADTKKQKAEIGRAAGIQRKGAKRQRRKGNVRSGFGYRVWAPIYAEYANRLARGGRRRHSHRDTQRPPVNEFPFQIKVEGSPQVATLRFASNTELRRYHRTLAPFARESSTIIREAVEFTRLAAKRWRYYSRSGEAAKSFAHLQREIRRDPKCEVAFIMVATLRRKHREMSVGLAYCRRTWCHHLGLDFLALHPRALDRNRRVSGVGSGMVFGLVQLARALEIPRIWGEATVNSAPFYEKLLVVHPVQDLFIIEAPEMAAITERQKKIGHAALVREGR
jgi:hypothetical protein